MAVYTTKGGDTWDIIAKELYESEYKADVLMAANPEHIGTFIFGAGVKLNAPDIDLDDDDEGDLPPWKYAAEDDEDD